MTTNGHGAVLQRVKSILGDLLDIPPDEIEDDCLIVESASDVPSLQLDSLDALKLSLSLSEEYSLSVPFDVDWDQVSTVRDVADLISSLTRPAD